MKKILAALLALLLLMAGAFAEVYDASSLLTEDEEAYLNEYAALIEEDGPIRIALCTSYVPKGTKLSDAAEELLSSLPQTDRAGTVLLLCDSRGKNFWVASEGAAEGLFPSARIKELRNETQIPYFLSKGLVAEAMDAFLAYTEGILEGYVPAQHAAPSPSPTPAPAISEDGSYTSKDEVAAYLRLYGHLPPNYITKDEARALGWGTVSGDLWKVAPGRSIGGDYFGNYQGLLPAGRYTECDIDYRGGTRRGEKRLVFRRSKGGWIIYYTEDHYNTFEEVN